MATIFISYSRTDIKTVKFLEPQIHNIYGYASLWYDKGIVGADDWWQRIVGEIRDCQLFLYLMSDESVKSEYCQKELHKAIYNRKTVLPVLLKTYTQAYPKNLPKDLANYMRPIQYIDLRKGYRDLSKLWGAINRVTDRSISFADRWMLYNQFEILRKLSENKGEAGQGDVEQYERYQEIISAGYERNYDVISRPIDPAMEYGDGEEVIKILEMYRAIHNACLEDDCSEISSPYLRFRGFDGNNEASFHAFARHIIFEQGLFAESNPGSDDKLNTHSPVLDKYQRMLEEWQKIENNNSLTKQDVKRIVDA